MPWICEGTRYWDNREAYANPAHVPMGMLRWGWSCDLPGMPSAMGQATSREAAKKAARMVYQERRDMAKRILQDIERELIEDGFNTPTEWYNALKREATIAFRKHLKITASQAATLVKEVVHY